MWWGIGSTYTSTLLFVSTLNTKLEHTSSSSTSTDSNELPIKDGSLLASPETDKYNRRNFVKNIASSLVVSEAIISPANAISSIEAETSYNKYAANYDALDGGSVADSLGIEEARTKMLQFAKGRVLEVGTGTGLNLGKYKFASSPGAMDGVTSLTLLDISEGMMLEAKAKLALLNVPDFVQVDFVKADATADLVSLFGVRSGTNGYFDTVVDTFSLCVMGNNGAKRCLEQMSRVVKKDGGRLLLIENARSSNPALGFYQDLTSDAAAKMGGKGCVSNQNVGDFIRNTDGLEIVSEELFAAGLFRFFVCKRVT